MLFNFEELTPVLFEPDKAYPWPSGLEVQETLLTVKTGKSCQVEIYIVKTMTMISYSEDERLVQSVTPVQVILKDSEGTYEAGQERRSENTPGDSLNEVQTSVKAGKPFSIPPHITDIDVEGLTPDQKEIVFKLLTEEQDLFARDGNDIGCRTGVRVRPC